MTLPRILLIAFVLALSVSFKMISAIPANAATLSGFSLPSIASEGEPECGDSDGDDECDTGSDSTD